MGKLLAIGLNKLHIGVHTASIQGKPMPVFSCARLDGNFPHKDHNLETLEQSPIVGFSRFQLGPRTPREGFAVESLG